MLGVREACRRRARARARRGPGGLASGALPSVPSRRIRSAAGARTAGVTMEKRAILAAVLMAAVFIVYQMFFFPEPPPPQKPPAQTVTEPAPAPASATPSPAPAPAAPTRTPQAPRPPQSLATVESPLYRDVVSSEGGKLQELQLRYRGEKPIVIVGDLGPAGLQLAPDANAPAAAVPLRFDREALVLTD